MRIAVTGGSGFIGKELAATLKTKGSMLPVVIGRGTKVIDSDLEYRPSDYSKEDLLRVLKDIDAVVHLAAVRGAGGKISDYHANEVITENLYMSCVEIGITNIVFSSSISVYSAEDLIPWTEEIKPSPKTLYGISKIACEYIGDIFHKKHGLNIKSLRFAHLLGEGEHKGFMMNTFIDSAFEKKTLEVIGRSLSVREYVYVKDVAAAILFALDRPEIHGAFNIGSGEAHTNFEIAELVNHCFGNENNLLYKDYLDEGIESSLMDSSKAECVLGYKPKYSMLEALKDIRKIKLDGTRYV